MSLEFIGKSYRLIFPEDRPFVYLESSRGERLAELFALSSVHPLNGRDDTPAASHWERAEANGVTTFMLHASSSVWRRKTYRMCCYPERLTYQIEVEGEGRLAEVNYFGGYYSGGMRWGSGYFWSGQEFSQLVNFEPNDCRKECSPDGYASVDLMGIPLPGRGDWYFTPPPFCFAVRAQQDWLALGVEAGPGQYQFTEYAYHGKPTAFHLSLAYEGYQQVEGRYSLPAIGIDFGENEYEALKKHVQALPVGEPAPDRRYDWWKTPIFCGWGAQSHLAAAAEGWTPDFSRREHYEEFLASLAANGIDPGMVVLDDKWQATYGGNSADEEKWPDLKGFIAGQHAQGRKVLLWLKAWDPEGLPAEECIRNSAGTPIACDPSHPAYRQHLGRMVEQMLSSDGYDADGFKLDFTARIPSGPGMQLHGPEWGLELLRTYLETLRREAKRVKPEALIMTHTPHPYLADLVDMVRLNDISDKKEILSSMRQRARVAAIACPEAIIDTDNWPMPDRDTWRKYMLEQTRLGVPSLYYATHIDSTGEPLEAEDYRLIREAWMQFRREQG